jgi:hypothetical protein
VCREKEWRLVKMKVEAIGMPWFREEDFDALRAMFTDGSKLHKTFAEWSAAATNGEAQLRNRGWMVVRAEVRPRPFARWCRARGLAPDAPARTAFASEVALKHRLNEFTASLGVQTLEGAPGERGMRSDESTPDLPESVVPVFLGTLVPDRVNANGSAVFVRIDQGHYLWTAAHVIDGKDRGALLVPIGSRLVEIEGVINYVPLPRGARRDHDPVDLAFIHLDQGFAADLQERFPPITEDRLEGEGQPFGPRSCAVVGYPASKSKESHGLVNSRLSILQGIGDWPGVVEERGLNSAVSILVHFRRERAVHVRTLRPVPVPGMIGMSGGAIFGWPPGAELSIDWSLPRLAGVAHTRKESDGVIIGTRTTVFLKAIRYMRAKR